MSVTVHVTGYNLSVVKFQSEDDKNQLSICLKGLQNNDSFCLVCLIYCYKKQTQQQIYPNPSATSFNITKKLKFAGVFHIHS